MLERWEAMDIYGRIRAGRGQAPAVDPPRRPALRQRPHPHGHRAQQDPQGLRRQVALHARAQRGLRAGLGLPRPAHRAPGGQGARARHRAHRRAPRDGPAREDPPLPRVRARSSSTSSARSSSGSASSATGSTRTSRWSPAYQADDRARVRPLRRARRRLQGPQARALVHALQDGAGRRPRSSTRTRRRRRST